ncbi:hypothetical protein [uncultured Gelidibacter sp.]|uniref:hypothetical protein n=1 Tax=uncultured Gelidibacter sp. TaxID=259318 RepID=UPI00262A4DAB|nr:hypothetical protein [uncultured Gelidibacter sp.]
MKTILIGLAFISFSNFVHSQTPETSTNRVKLDEVIISPIKNVSYYKAVYDPYAAKGVKDLETIVAKHDVSASDVYGNYDSYMFIFKNSVGKIVTMYDKDGELLTSIEKFKDIQLPEKVRLALLSKYPGWGLNSTVFRVKYAHNKDVEKAYYLQIQKGTDKLNVKVNCDGDVLKSGCFASL